MRGGYPHLSQTGLGTPFVAAVFTHKLQKWTGQFRGNQDYFSFHTLELLALVLVLQIQALLLPSYLLLFCCGL